jgi:acetyl-CoA carboxylase biotin carboxyl carrier protein
MDGKQDTRQGSPYSARKKSASMSDSDTGTENGAASLLSIEQLQRLVTLLDSSDVSEVELKQAGEGTHLVLRKVKNTGSNEQAIGVVLGDPQTDATGESSSTTSVEKTKPIVAHLVGIFHTWAKPRGGALVAVGDRVKVGQHVATIESLNVLNEVDSPIAGHVVEILVEDGQPVEYGQHLMMIDSQEMA